MTTLGNKHECFSCGAKFYDLGKPAIVCPTCGTDQGKENAEGKGEAPKSVEADDVPESEPSSEQEDEAEAGDEAGDEADDKADDEADDEADDDDLDEAFEEEDDDDLLDDD